METGQKHDYKHGYSSFILLLLLVKLNFVKTFYILTLTSIYKNFF